MITINNKKLCENCFAETTVDPCPHCGFTKTAYRHDPVTLAVGSILNQRYMIGGAIGKGGFGITYLAYDLKLDARLAVKEYYPMGLAVRNPGSKLVTVSNAEGEDSFRTGAEKFYNEAKMVARFNGNPNIVSVHDFFYENDTVYFTMGYLQGQTLKSYIRNKNITEGQAVNILIAISSALMASHSLNILHRDVSPDNIMLCDDGSIRLLDFGAARQVMAEQSQSLSVILKQGFAPLEQYQKKGKQGPWTDIYALGATVYTALTGDMLSDPMTRLEDDTDFNANKFGISDKLWAVIQKCTQLKIADRYQDIPSLKADLAQIGIDSAPFTDIKEEITDILRHRMSRPFGTTKDTSVTPNFAPADPNATMLLGGGSGENLTMSMAEPQTGYNTGQPQTGYNTGQPQTGYNTGQPQQQYTGQPPYTGQPQPQYTGQPPYTGQPQQQYTGQPQPQPQNAAKAASAKKFPVAAIIGIAVAALAVMGFIGYKVISTMIGNVIDINEPGDYIEDGTDGTDTDDGTDTGDGTDSGDGTQGVISSAGDEATMIEDLGEKDIQKYTHSKYRYSICFPSDYNVSEQDDGTVELSKDDLHVAVRFRDRYIDDTILYDAQDMTNMINARPENLLPSEGSGSTPEVDDAGRVDIAGQENVSHFGYRYEDRKGNNWEGNVYLFDPEGQYGCYMVYTLLKEGADDHDTLSKYAAACADSFRIDGAYDPPEVKIFEFDDYGIKFSMTNGTDATTSDTDSAKGSVHVKFKNSKGKNKTAYVIPGEHFGTEFVDMFTGASRSLSKSTVEITSDMQPLDFGEYKGYWVETEVTDASGNEEGGRIYAFQTPAGSDATYQSYVVMGMEADDDSLREIVGGFRFEGSTTYDNTQTDTDDTISLDEGTAGDDINVPEDTSTESEYIFEDTDVKRLSEDDVYSFLRDYLDKNAGSGMSEKEKKMLCARALCYARNEIYARHGYIFNSGELRDLFNSKSWYEGTIPSDRFNSAVFTETEKSNIELLKAMMDEYGGYQPAK